MTIIPLSKIPAQIVNIVLGGQNCTIAVYLRGTRLFMDLTVGMNVVCRGAVCEAWADILQSRSEYFQGSLRFVDMEGDLPPQYTGLFDGMAGRWKLCWFADGELE